MADDTTASSRVFDVVTHETRAGILRALADAHRESPDDPALGFNDLRHRIGEHDSGNFNYHLDRLGDLVAHTDDGYVLSRVGMRAVSALRSGVFDTEWTWGPVDAPGDCRVCGDALEFQYRDGALHVTCGDDDHALALYVTPSFLTSQPADALGERTAYLENGWGELVRRGICSECQGRVDGEVREFDGRTSHYRYCGDCQRCGFQHWLPLGMYLLGHPDVLQFHFEHGVDVREVPFWTLDWCAPGAETVESTDPLRVRLAVDAGGETLSLTVDRSGDVVSTARR